MEDSSQPACRVAIAQPSEPEGLAAASPAKRAVDLRKLLDGRGIFRGVSKNPEDELARTATAPASAGSSVAAEPLGATLGRYRLERELGAGGMGVVHAAFDPDLERRVALKVLRSIEGGSEARQRLLREARAMARLAHPNVVTVHEVGSANGRDYVAMEIVDGQNLAEWVRSEPRAEDQIVEAFIAAGRGLAAAHAAGIVHRDFKPHNVLRHRNGRVVVTDFGLAREAQEAPDPHAATRRLTRPLADSAASTSTPSSPLAGLTMTGSVLGTPAYMAPEQWQGGMVTPATDQFAFCVALWEALAGERPFRGATLEALRADVERGPGKLDASKIPRRLRPALLRGLDPDPARRWPSMESLLDAMAPPLERRSNRGIALVLGGAAVIAAAIGIIRDRDPAPAAAVATPSCRAPVLDLLAVWPADAVSRLVTAGQRPAAAQLAADVEAWRTARAKACKLAGSARDAQLSCLDGVLSRLDAIARGVAELGGSRHVDAGAYLIDPTVCEISPTPRLRVTTPELRTAFAAVMREGVVPGRPKPDVANALIEQVKRDPCAAAFARMLAVTAGKPEGRERQLADAAEESERCDDERVHAEIALTSAQFAFESAMLGTMITSKLKLAEVASQRVAQPDVVAAIDSLRSEVARRADQLTEAITRAESAMRGYAARHRTAAELEQGIEILELKRSRATAEDLASILPTLEAWRARAVEELGADDKVVRTIDMHLGDWQFRTGDPAAAHARLTASYRPEPNDPARRIRGKVFDAAGVPVAGATVGASAHLNGDQYGLMIPIESGARITTTAADGTFEIADAPELGALAAQLGELRSRPTAIADAVTLKLEPTGQIEGRVDLQGQPAPTVLVIAVDPSRTDLRASWAAPVRPDGTFTIAGFPRGRIRVFTVVQRGTAQTGIARALTVKAATLQGVALEVPSTKRVIHVLVRSTVGAPVVNAAVVVTSGRVPSMSARQLRKGATGINERPARQIEGEHAPAAVVGAARAGDLFATMSDVPEGVASACAIALPADLADPSLRKKIDTNLDKLILQCVPIAEKADVVVIEVPPFPRLD